MVIFTVIPYDVYKYKVIRGGGYVYESGGTVSNGDDFPVNLPRKPLSSQAELSYYNAVIADGQQIILKHTPGEPFSYYNTSDRESFKGKWEDGIFSDVGLTVGQGSSTATISRSTMTESEQGAEVSASVSMEVEAKAMGVTGGYSFGLEAGVSWSTTVGSGTEISGTVASLPAATYNVNANQFTWGIMAFPHTQSSGYSREYMLITYWVTAQ
jgi:hypothetical protein